MNNRYLVEIRETYKKPITVEASDESEARESVLKGAGTVGQFHPAEIEVIAIKELDERS